MVLAGHRGPAEEKARRVVGILAMYARAEARTGMELSSAGDSFVGEQESSAHGQTRKIRGREIWGFVGLLVGRW